MPTDSYTESPGAAAEVASGGRDFASYRTLSEHDRASIRAIAETRMRIKLAQGQAREDTKAVADRLGMKASELNRIVSLAMRERERGNVLSQEKALIELAEQLVF
jgi:hypothetical protein